jgi:glycogen operon protein
MQAFKSRGLHRVKLQRAEWIAQAANELSDAAGGEHLHVMLNAYWEPLLFELPPLPPGERWLRLVDTALAPPDDLADPPSLLSTGHNAYRLEARSSVILIAGRA